jgi:predicted  nucleic acid-binding Zn-ribbon protein
MKNNISRIEAEHTLDELLQAQKNGLPVSLSQIQAADDDWTRAARLENIASLNNRLYACGAEFETLAEQRTKARDALKKLLQKKDQINVLMQKIETYLDGVNLKLNIAAVEESEVLALLEEV